MGESPYTQMLKTPNMYVFILMYVGTDIYIFRNKSNSIETKIIINTFLGTLRFLHCDIIFVVIKHISPKFLYKL